MNREVCDVAEEYGRKHGKGPVSGKPQREMGEEAHRPVKEGKKRKGRMHSVPGGGWGPDGRHYRRAALLMGDIIDGRHYGQAALCRRSALDVNVDSKVCLDMIIRVISLIFYLLSF